MLTTIFTAAGFLLAAFAERIILAVITLLIARWLWQLAVRFCGALIERGRRAARALAVRILRGWNDMRALLAIALATAAIATAAG